MPAHLHLETPRLLLRPIEERDRDPFVAMNLDPDVMRFFASTFTPGQSAEHIARYQAQLARDGFSFLTVEHRHTGQYLGILGLQTMRDVVPNLPQPAVEIGWRLVKSAHGHGYATEGARAIVHHAFSHLGLPSLVAITATGNTASRHVMEKLGMTHRPELTFDHPRIPAGHPCQRHVLYSLSNPHPPAPRPAIAHTSKETA